MMARKIMTNAAEILQVTERAATHLQKLLHERKAAGFRLSVKKTGCSGYKYQPELIEKINENDIRIEANNGVMLFVDPNCVSMIKGTTMDYVTVSLGQSQLQFANPNAVNECGCGESFNLKEEA